MNKRRIVTHKHLKPLRLQHHRHTGRMLHHKHTSYRGLAMIIGLAGALMIGIGNMSEATADILTVTARNPAPIPTIPATITSPENNAIIQDSQVEISGTCEAASPSNIITILDNGEVAGSAPCQGSGIFSLLITLALGEHTLIAKTYNITDDPGPDSAPVFVTRIADPNAPTTNQPGNNTDNPTQDDNGQQVGEPLVIKQDRPFITFGPGKDAVWNGTITGGSLPYRVHIDWGSDGADDYTITTAGQQSFTHHYDTMKPHIVTLQAIDASGQTAIIQFAAVTPYTPPATISLPKQPWNGPTLVAIYGAYLVLLATFGTIWVLAHPAEYVLAQIGTHSHSATKHIRRHKGIR